jgi:hypothetical protein
MMRTLKTGAAYFALVFGTGFVLGSIRTLWLVPQLGVRTAELLEMPFMLVAIVLAARWLMRPIGHRAGALNRLVVGGVGLLLLLIAETIVGVALQGLSVVEVFTKHDPVSGTAYYAMLGVFAAMPWLLGRDPKLFSGIKLTYPPAHH